MSRGEVGKLQGKVLGNLKKSKKPLDNGLPPCYNKDTERGKATRKKGKPTRASKTFPTKTLTRKVCRFASNKCEPEPRG